MTQEIVIAETGELVPVGPGEFVALDPYSETGLAIVTQRPSWLATVSAGFKNDKGYPESSKDGRIFISDPEQRAPKLAEILRASGGKMLTVVFPSDNIDDFVQQRFARRSTSGVEVYGDRWGLTEIINTEAGKNAKGEPIIKSVHVTHSAGSPEYKQLKATCKAETSVLFALGEWITGPSGVRCQVSFPDGFGWYRIRFTSRNSLWNIVGKLQEVREKVTKGRLAGLPFELSITYREVPGPDGRKRKIPVWALLFRPPETIRLTSGNLGQILRGAIEEGEKLQMLPAPRPETLDMALSDAAALGYDDEELVQVLTSEDTRCDPAYYERIYFAMTRGTPYHDDEGRAKLVGEYTAEHWTSDTAEAPDSTDSLSEFLAHSTEQEASTFIAHLSDLLDADLKARRRERVVEGMVPQGDLPSLNKTMRPDDEASSTREEAQRAQAAEQTTAAAAQQATLDEAPPNPTETRVTSSANPAWVSWLALVERAKHTNGVEFRTLPKPEQQPISTTELRDRYAELAAAIKAAEGGAS